MFLLLVDDPNLKNPCPTCGAGPWTLCRILTGNREVTTYVHKARNPPMRFGP